MACKRDGRIRVLLLASAFIVSGAAAQPVEQAQPEPDSPLPAIEEAVWPPVLPSLRVLIRPRPESDRTTGPSSPPEETGLLMRNGRRANLLGFLTRKRSHETDWHEDQDFAAANRTLRPGLTTANPALALVERADLALIMGGARLGMSAAQIYVSYGFLEDGSLPRPSGYGVISPIDPESCPEGGISCRQTILKN